MANSLNRVSLIGRLGRDPEIRYKQAGDPVASFSIATSKSWKGDDGEWQESVEWHRITAWKYLAERAEKFLRKGKQVYIEGELRTRKWEKDGQNHYTTEIVAKTLIVLGKKDDEPPSENAGKFDPPPMGPKSGDDEDLPF